MIRRRALVAVPIACIALLGATAGRAADHVLSVICRLLTTEIAHETLTADQRSKPVHVFEGCVETAVDAECVVEEAGARIAVCVSISQPRAKTRWAIRADCS